MTQGILISDNDILLIVDVLNDFCPGGALAVPRGDEIVPVINGWLSDSRTSCWCKTGIHPATFRLPPCTISSPTKPLNFPMGRSGCGRTTVSRAPKGAAFHRDLAVPHAALVLRKGIHKEIDSYSALYENDRKTPTGLSVTSGSAALRVCFWPGWPWTSAFATRQRTHNVRASRLQSSRTRAAPSTSAARSRPPAAALPSVQSLASRPTISADPALWQVPLWLPGPTIGPRRLPVTCWGTRHALPSIDPGKPARQMCVGTRGRSALGRQSLRHRQPW